MTTVDETEALAVDALRWMRSTARDTGGGGLGWPVRPSDHEVEPTLYDGTAGVIPVLLEAWRHFGDDAYADTALRAARSLADVVDDHPDDSLYFGLTGIALVLRTVHRDLGSPAADAAADRALARVRSRFDGTRWGDLFELMGGNAGIGLGALLCGDAESALAALEPYARTAEPTAAGVTWQWCSGAEPRLHHLAHGALGIAYALTVVGAATAREDLVGLAQAAVAEVVSRDEAGPEGFLVPHSDPQHRPDVVERHSYGWCHGPTGDAQVFRMLRHVLGEPSWSDLADRCWHTVTRSGLPRRLRPGFWDNNGRCCGTAGVLALACDRIAEQGDSPDFARTLVSDLASRATRDADGARWHNVEHRAAATELEPHTGWAMGNAGIARELLRHVRSSRGGDPRYAFAWPDQPAVRVTAPQATEPIRPADEDATS